MTETRIERDTMGEVWLPAGALYGAQTQRAVENFPISGQPLPPEMIHALGLVKLAAARVNRELGLLDPDIAAAIEQGAREVAEGELDDQFPIDVFQTGSGTSSNMNANEVIAAVASRELGRRVHPNDEVNLGQSSNDVIPTTLHVAAVLGIERDLLPALRYLHDTLSAKAAEFDDVVKIGRTHLMDAVPIRLGQEFGGYARQIELAIERIEATLPGLRELAIGGTAVGTGLNTHEEFGARGGAGPAHRHGVPGGGESFRGAGLARCLCLHGRRAERAGGGADEDRQRYPIVGLRTAGRAGRADPASHPAWQLDHAGQGQPGHQ